MAPIQSVYAVQDRHFCLVKAGENDWETREVEVDGDNSTEVLINSGLKTGEQLVMNPGAFKELMELPELERDTKIEVSDEMRSRIKDLQDKKSLTLANQPGSPNQPESAEQAKAARPGQGGGAGFSMPSSGADLIKQKDQDGDGKLTKDEAGTPYSYFFDRVDTDSDGFISESEADQSIKQMKRRMQQGGGGQGGRPQ